MTKLEEVRNVVIIINDDDSNLKDLYDKGPSCLTPLVNVPIIHYLMIKLLSAKLRNFLIFCGKYRKSIRKFFKDVCYQNYVNYNLKLEFISDENIINECDALRYLDNLQYNEDFILLHGDVLINCDVQDLLSGYQIKIKQNTDIIMSMVVGLDQNEFTKPCSWVKIDEETKTFSNKGTNLINPSDPQIYICSKNVPLRSHDYRDSSTIYSLIDNVIVNSEVINDSIHIIPISNACFRISSINSFFHASSLIIRGNIYLCSPHSIFGDNIRTVKSSDPIISSHNSSYVCSAYSKDFMPCTTRFIGNVQVQIGCEIGLNCRFFDTIIGKNCIIGDNVILKNCVLMDDVVIEDNCLLTYTFLGKFAKVGNYSQIVKSVVQYNSVIESHTKMQFRYFSADDRSSIWDIHISSDCVPETILISNEADEFETGEFESDIFDLLNQAFEESMTSQDLNREISRLRIRMGMIEHYLYTDVCEAFLKYPLKIGTRDAYDKNVDNLLVKYGSVLSTLLMNDTEKKKLCLEVIQECACTNETIRNNVTRIIFSMYENEIVDEDDIRDWYNTSLVDDNDDQVNSAIIKNNLTKFMEYLDE